MIRQSLGTEGKKDLLQLIKSTSIMLSGWGSIASFDPCKGQKRVINRKLHWKNHTLKKKNMTVQAWQQPRLTKGHNLLRRTTCGESYLPHDSDNLDLEAGWNKMSLFGEFVKPEINKLTIIRPGDWHLRRQENIWISATIILPFNCYC